MNKKFTLLCSLLFFAATLTYGQASLTGKVTDDAGQPAPLCNVVLYKNGVLKTGVQTDFDGNYRFTDVDAGSYNVQVSLVGFKTYLQTGVVIGSGKAVRLDIKLEKGVNLEEVVIHEYRVPIVERDNTTQGQTLTSDQIRELPVKNLAAIAAMTAGVAVGADGAINIKGSRSDANAYYVDGVRVRSIDIPSVDIEEFQVITGGLEAKYGDVTGGVISINTKGPASKFTGGAEVETSKYLDPSGYTLANINFAGPIISKTTMGHGTESILGFRLSGQFQHEDDPNIPATPVYRVKDSVLQRLLTQPVSYIGGNTAVASAEKLYKNAYDTLNYHPNNKSNLIDVNGKLDLRINQSMDLTGSLGFHNDMSQFTPSYSAGGSQYPGGTYTYLNNPSANTTRYRTNLRFRQRLTDAGGGDKNSGLLIGNASYSLQAGYELQNVTTQDPVHKDHFFEYGYIGQFNHSWVPSFAVTQQSPSSPLVFKNSGYTDVFTGYQPDPTYNPVLTAFNKDIQDGASESDYNVLNGLYNKTTLASVYGFQANVGSVYNSSLKTDRALTTFTGTLNFDLYPGGSKENAHNIEFGLYYEQRESRGYQIAPFSLWDLATKEQNVQINGIDTNVVLRDTMINSQLVHIYRPLIKNIGTDPTFADVQFWKKVRQSLGVDNYTYVNVNSLKPSQLSLDMFSGQELNDAGLLYYYGYDYLGHKLTNKVGFNDFFTSVNADGVRTFPVAAVQPVYMAGYIQDKFTYKDLIFRVGLRVDRYDANTKVLKDPYSLYDLITAKDYYKNTGQKKPDNISDDYKVYVTRDGSAVAAYRQGDAWFDKKGAPTDPSLLFGTNGQPFAKFYADTIIGIKQRGFDPSHSFEDYTPQINWMPRLSFSFPISDVANFFAHYDVLVQRPPSNTIVTALDYYYFYDQNRTTENNANLKPEKTIDYEVGFQQKLTNTSGLKVAAFYKELRDMIQLRIYKYIPQGSNGLGGISQYTTYGNLDFGTVKGFTLQYDLRRTNHISALIAYTLQFADGTGSDPQSQRELAQVANVRTLSPLDYDERHRISATIDYRYDGGSKYDGPMLFGTRFFENAGINIQTTAVSGRPYTPALAPVTFGSSGIAGTINSANKPWTINLDGRIDKTFSISKNPKNPLDINIYFRVTNILDVLNIADVYKATGSPTDDGYLISAQGQSALANTLRTRPNDYNAYVHSYLMRELNPGNYFAPRRIFLGATFGF